MWSWPQQADECGGAQMGDTCELSVQAAAALCGEGEELSYWQLMVRICAAESWAGIAWPSLQWRCMRTWLRHSPLSPSLRAC